MAKHHVAQRVKEIKIRKEIANCKKKIKKLQRKLTEMGVSALSEHEHIACNSQMDFATQWKTFTK